MIITLSEPVTSTTAVGTDDALLFAAGDTVGTDDALLFTVDDEEPDRKAASRPDAEPWDVLVVDDDAEVHAVTRMVLGSARFAGRPMRLHSAHSAAEARSCILRLPRVAVILLDVVMDTEDAGLRFVEFVRQELDNSAVRIVLRTGQPGYAPERDVITAYDINDYRTKTELTAQRLFTTVVASLRAYDEIVARQRAEEALREARDGLEQDVADRTRELRATAQSLASELRERRRIAEQLRASEELFRRLFDQTFDLLIISDEDGRITMANRAAEALLGYSNPQLQALSMDDLHSPEHRGELEAMHQRVLRDGRALITETYLKAKDGRRLPVGAGAVAVDIGGRPHVMASFRDITSRKQAEEERTRLEAQLRQSQKLEAVGTLAGGVAHEINNPISGIMNYAQLIQDETPPDSTNHEFAGEIINETERVAAIVRNLLSFARIDPHRHSRTHIRVTEVIGPTVSLVRAVVRRDQITLEMNVPEGLPTVYCHSQQIQQVLMNLATNARDSLNERYAKYDEQKRIRVSARTLCCGKDIWVRITVEDFGQGIPVAVQPHVFEPFFTTKNRATGIGTGLGLAVSYGIVQQHGGRLHFETEPGQFTRFHIDLPTTPA